MEWFDEAGFKVWMAKLFGLKKPVEVSSVVQGTPLLTTKHPHTQYPNSSTLTHTHAHARMHARH